MIKATVWQRIWRDTMGVRSSECAEWVNDSVLAAWQQYDKLMVWNSIKDRSIYSVLEDYEWNKESYYNYFSGTECSRYSAPHQYYNDTRDSDAVMELLSYGDDDISWDTHSIEWSMADVVASVRKHTGITLDQHWDSWNGDHLTLGIEVTTDTVRDAHIALLWMLWEDSVRENLWNYVTEALVEVATVTPLE